MNSNGRKAQLQLQPSWKAHGPLPAAVNTTKPNQASVLVRETDRYTQKVRDCKTTESAQSGRDWSGRPLRGDGQGGDGTREALCGSVRGKRTPGQGQGHTHSAPLKKERKPGRG